MPTISPSINPVSDPRRKRRRWRNFVEALQNASGLPDVEVGQRMRELRTERGLSIRALAELSGLNVNTLSMIENGKTSPSVATLQQVAFALAVPITAFFENGAPQSKVAFQKADQRRKAAFAHGTLEDLGEGMVSRGAEPFLIVLNPHADSGEAPIVHTGREFVFCLEGCLAYRVEEQEYLLEPGDSLLFEAHLPHRWHNASEVRTRALLVLCPADAQDRPTEQHFSPNG